MTARLTEEQERAIRARAEAARAYEGELWFSYIGSARVGAFLETAPEDTIALLAELDAVRADLDHARVREAEANGRRVAAELERDRLRADLATLREAAQRLVSAEATVQLARHEEGPGLLRALDAAVRAHEGLRAALEATKPREG